MIYVKILYGLITIFVLPPMWTSYCVLALKCSVCLKLPEFIWGVLILIEIPRL